MEPQFISLNGISLHYTVEGEGPDVVFVHGWGASRRTWAYLARHLGRAYRCWTLDLPGFGDSDKPAPAWDSLPCFTEAVSQFLAAHGLEAAGLVGHSMGGMIVLDMAAGHPRQVGWLIVINPVVTGRATLRHLARPQAVSRHVLGWAQLVAPRVLQPVLAHPLGFRLPGMHYLRRRTEDFGRATPDSLLASGRAVLNYDVSPRLGQIAAPALVIVGGADRSVSASEGRLAARQIPNARLHEVRAGHMATDDRPAEVLRVVQRFLA